MISATVTAGLPGSYDWEWIDGGNYGGGPIVSSSVVPPGWVTARFWPDDGNGSSCEDSVGVVQCHRFYCEHGRPARECGLCTGGSSEEWCGLHDKWKCVCACLTMGGGGMLAPGAETDFMIGATGDSCEHHIHDEHCCDCAEHMGWGGWWAEEKTNVIRQISTRLDVRLDGAPVAVGRKLVGPILLTVGGEQLSETFGDARIIASHELHPSDTVTSSWTVAAIGLDPGTQTAGPYRIRGGTGCVSRVAVLTDSALVQGSLLLDAGYGGLRFSSVRNAPWDTAQWALTNTPPYSVAASRDFWLGASAGGTHTLEYSLRTPQGTTCLSTNLLIEAIVAKFATNVYYAAHGSTEEMLVDLDSYSHDSAGYTLRLDGALIATGQPPWQVSVSHLAPGAHTLTLRSETFPDLADEATVYVVRAALVPDYDRDGVIGALDKARAATNTLFRWWINDDDDNGSDVSEGEDDVPGQVYGMTTVSNDTQWPDSDEVDGRCDLLDFFPLWLDIEGLPSAAQTDGNWTLRLSQADSADQVVYIDLSAASAGSYLVSDVTGCGQDFTQSAHEAQTLRVGADGMGLVPAFLSRIVANPQKCVLLVEGRAATQSPLVLEVFRNGTRIARGEMPLRISGVEDMYRWVNLRGVAGGGESRPTDLTVPSGFPDACSSGKHFIFVHGYNVSEEKARAWNAEMFKRLWQAGSKAMYTAVTWHGNDSQAWWWLNKTPNYYANVANAFATASNLAATVNGSLPGAVKVIAGHSLGNMVISSAIVDHGLNADTYFMLNAAVAQEAYDAAVDHADTMRHPDWQGYARRLWASDWCNLFTNDTADARGTLTWRDRFGDIPGAINYYSSTEDVLANSDGTLHTFLASDWSWVNQEMRKGLWPFLVPGNNEAGWAFNRSHDVTVGYDPHTGAPVKELMPPATANLLPGSVLQTNSFFSLFDNRALYGTNGSAVAAQPAVRAQLLADAIPALSDPMGCNPLDWGFVLMEV